MQSSTANSTSTSSSEHEDNKENIPPTLSEKQSDPDSKPAWSSKKTKRKFKKSVRKPLADITSLFENSAAQTHQSGSAQGGACDSVKLDSSTSGVSAKQLRSAMKRKAIDEEDDDKTGELKSKSKSLRMGYR